MRVLRYVFIYVVRVVSGPNEGDNGGEYIVIET